MLEIIICVWGLIICLFLYSISNILMDISSQLDK